ncbi:MAG: cell division protein SepF [Porcipelethomonas sp.]
MDVFKNIKDFFVPPEDGDDQYEERSMRRESSRSDYDERDSREQKSYRTERYDDYEEKKSNKVVNVHATAQLQVVLVKPEKYEDAKEIANHLISKKTVVLNLEAASAEHKRRIIDFLVGVAYAQGGSLKRVANLTYVITPYNVDFIGDDLMGELESNGVII